MLINRFVSILVLTPLLSTTAFAQSRLSWEDQSNLGGTIDQARAVAVSGNTTVIAGLAGGGASLDVIVRGYDVRSGAVRWTDRTPAFAGIATDVFVASDGADNVYAAGYTASNTPFPLCCTDIFVRGYDARTGRVLWHDVLDKGRDDYPTGIAANAAAVVVVGYGGNTGGTAVHWFVRSYHPTTGGILWEDAVNHGDLVDDIPWAVALDGDRVFVAGSRSAASGDGTRDLVVRAYDVATGLLLWEVQRPSTSPTALAAGNGQVFVAGYATGTGFNAFAGAYDGGTGGLHWADTSASGYFTDVKLRFNRLVLVGPGVRVYDPATGVPQWQVGINTSPGFFDYMTAVELGDKAVYVGGSVGANFGYSEFAVRAYDVESGALLFDDRSHRTPNDFASGVQGLAISRNRVFAVGRTSNAATPLDSDLLIRAYEVKDIEGAGPRSILAR